MEGLIHGAVSQPTHSALNPHVLGREVQGQGVPESATARTSGDPRGLGCLLCMVRGSEETSEAALRGTMKAKVSEGV